ncbi:hypothetical protein GCM10010178_69370 [Lentzea flava]|uniref:Uncharacterized protein n=1 Tax=Lentzea flava TaxID=103732 RepID=A0ABQ2V6V2_9PSEU|nr:hypothetical protein [Lentzea flava]GGU67765.1 hypothetical protein GCM10010178_69370 [Lentzea flava]
MNGAFVHLRWTNAPFIVFSGCLRALARAASARVDLEAVEPVPVDLVELRGGLAGHAVTPRPFAPLQFVINGVPARGP